MQAHETGRLAGIRRCESSPPGWVLSHAWVREDRAFRVPTDGSLQWLDNGATIEVERQSALPYQSLAIGSWSFTLHLSQLEMGGSDMTDERKNQPRTDRPAYEPPRVMRMGDPRFGTGDACDASGSSADPCNACGYTAFGCGSNGCCALNCSGPGDSAQGCEATGNGP